MTTKRHAKRRNNAMGKDEVTKRRKKLVLKGVVSHGVFFVFSRLFSVFSCLFFVFSRGGFRYFVFSPGVISLFCLFACFFFHLFAAP